MTNLATYYQNMAVKTASPAEITLMLYNGAIKFCNLAIEGIEAKNIMKAHTNFIKVQNIIDELQTTLDFRYDVAKDFNTIYLKIMKDLRVANVKKDINKAKEALEEIRDMRDVWAKIMKVAKTA